MLQQSIVDSREHAVELGRQMVRDGTIHHVCDEHHFKDEPMFYRFLSDEPDSVLQKWQHISTLDVSHGGVLAQCNFLGGWTERVFGLVGNILYMYKTAFAVSPAATYLISEGECSVSECEECHPGRYAFSLTIGSGMGTWQKLMLSAASSAEQEAWLVALLNVGVKFVEDSPDTGTVDLELPSSLFELSANGLDSGELKPFSKFAGRVCLVVNVASS
jgi:hypothetical protein